MTQTGSDLLGVLDSLRSLPATSLFSREPDNDADGMSNAFETQHGLNRDWPLDAHQDNDGDGADNLAESIAGTDPNDASSIFKVVSLSDTSTHFSVTWPSKAGRSDGGEWSTDLSTWNTFSTEIGDASFSSLDLDKNSVDSFDNIIGNLRQLFVRVEVISP